MLAILDTEEQIKSIQDARKHLSSLRKEDLVQDSKATTVFTKWFDGNDQAVAFGYFPQHHRNNGSIHIFNMEIIPHENGYCKSFYGEAALELYDPAAALICV